MKRCRAGTLAGIPGTLAATGVLAQAFPAKPLRELIALAKRHPGITCANSGIGTVTHMTAEKFRLRAGIEVTAVSYKGGA